MTGELVANYSRTRAHYSTDLRLVDGMPGRTGFAMCSTDGNPIEVYDAETHAAWEKRWGLTPKALTDLPLCKKCQRIADRPNTTQDGA